MGSHPFLWGWVAGLATAAAAGGAAGAFVLLGGFDISARDPHSAPVARLMHTTMRNDVRRRALDVAEPPGFTASQLTGGIRLYASHCLACHGAPGIGRARWASALVPTPPYLLDASGRWRRRELFVIIRDGVKMTAMPAWGEVRREGDIWSLVAAIDAMPKMTPARFTRLLADSRPQASEAARATLPWNSCQ